MIAVTSVIPVAERSLNMTLKFPCPGISTAQNSRLARAARNRKLLEITSAKMRQDNLSFKEASIA